MFLNANNHKLIKNQMCNEPDMFRAVFSHVASHDFTAAVVLNIEHAQVAASTPGGIKDQCPEHLGSEHRLLLCYELQGLSSPHTAFCYRT